MVPNVAYVEQISEWVRRQSGVKEVHSEALQEVVLNRGYYERGSRSVRLRSEGEKVPS